MRLLYPCDVFDSTQPDDVYQAEYAAAKAAGIACSLFSMEDFECGDFRPRPTFTKGEQVVYRGWMLSPDHYADLYAAISNKGAVPLTSIAQYRYCHYLPEWYSACEGFTPKTIFTTKEADFKALLTDVDWQAYFIKDYVKSLTTSRGSVVGSIDDIAEVIELIEKYKGSIEGGICIREYEHLFPQTEERYFVFKGKAFARDGVVPELVQQIVARIDSPFFSVDLVQAADGDLRLIELGDGQVSDIKKWPAERFIQMFLPV